MLALGADSGAGVGRSGHDRSGGGVAVAAAEMACAGGLGVTISLDAVPAEGACGEAALLFGESPGRFIVEVRPDNYDAFMRIVKDCPLGELGRVTDTGRIVVTVRRGTVIDLPAADAKAAWQGTFHW